MRSCVLDGLPSRAGGSVLNRDGLREGRTNNIPCCRGLFGWLETLREPSDHTFAETDIGLPSSLLSGWKPLHEVSDLTNLASCIFLADFSSSLPFLNGLDFC